MWKDTLPDGTSYFDRMAAHGGGRLAEGVVPADVMTGWRQAVADMLEMIRDLKPDGVKAADAFFVKAGALGIVIPRATLTSSPARCETRRRSSPLVRSCKLPRASHAGRARLCRTVEEERGPATAQDPSRDGSPGMTRTCDPVINSHLLCQLSYWGMAGAGM